MAQIGDTEILFSRETCERCNGSRLVFAEIGDIEKKEGRASEDLLFGEPTITQLMDRKKTSLLIPQVMVLYDYCRDCGCRFVVKIIKIFVPRPQPQGSPLTQIPRMKGMDPPKFFPHQGRS